MQAFLLAVSQAPSGSDVKKSRIGGLEGDHEKYTRGRPGEENTPAWSDNKTGCGHTITKRRELAKRLAVAVFGLSAGCGNNWLLNSILSVLINAG